MKALAGIKMSFELQRLVHKVCDFVVMAPSKGLLFRYCFRLTYISEVEIRRYKE